jgi:glutaredoxin-like YruB-family protein
MVKVKIYTTTTCPYCKMEKDYLDSKGVRYENVFIDNDTNAAQEMFEESGQMGVPFTEVIKGDGTKVKILGFDKEKLNEAVGVS